MLSCEPECDFTTVLHNEESWLDDKTCSKMSKDAKQYTIHVVLKLAPLQNMPQSNLFSEDVNALAKSCSLRFHITSCKASVDI